MALEDDIRNIVNEELATLWTPRRPRSRHVEITSDPRPPKRLVEGWGIFELPLRPGPAMPRGQEK